MSAWVQIAQITLTKNWQFTDAVAGKFFRVRHLLGRRVFSGWVAQADISNPAVPTLAEVRSLYCKEQGDLYEFPVPIAFGSRAIGVKRLDDSLSPWTLAIDVLDFSVEENPNVYTEFSGAAAALMDLLQGRDFADVLAAIAAHEASQNPHPEYVSGLDLMAALSTRITGADLAAAVEDKATIAQLAAELQNYVTTSALNAALATKENTIILTTSTPSNALTEMSNPQRVIIPPNSTVGYEVFLTGRNMAPGATEFIYWLGSGCMTRGATAASTVLNSPIGTRRSSLGNGSNWGPTLSADTLNGALRIQVKGDLNKPCKWVARVQLTEVA